MANKKSFLSLGLLVSLLYIVVGALLLIFPYDILGWAITIIGAAFIVLGAIVLLNKKWFLGALAVILGTVIIVLGWTRLDVVLLAIGILIIVKGSIALNDILKSGNASWFQIISPALSIICGLMLAFGNGLAIIMTIGAILIILDGLFGLIASLKK